MKYVLLSFGFFLVQNVSSFSRVARYTPSLSCIKEKLIKLCDKLLFLGS